MKYQIVQGNYEIESRVNELINEGWVPLGGIHVVVRDYEDGGYSETEVIYYQAMILNEGEDSGKTTDRNNEI